MTKPDLDLPIDLIRECVLLSRRWRVTLDERLKPTGMTFARATVLYWVNELPEGTSQRELADVLGIEGPTLVRLLHALEALGLIERVANKIDRRAKGIRLTPAALPLLDEVLRLSSDVSREYMSGLDRRRLPSAIGLVREARTALDRT